MGVGSWRLEAGEEARLPVSAIRKIGGILTETSVVGDRIDYAVVGIGLNVNVDFADRPELAETAASIMAVAGRAIDRLSVLAAVIGRFARRFEWLSADESLRTSWSARLVTLNRRVEARVGETVLAGLAQAVADDGALLLRGDDGRLHRLPAADVTLRT
jgi:BirA family biotin operon repressor/biotin-[acetyl-CoA-carboxylase] ligase